MADQIAAGSVVVVKSQPGVQMTVASVDEAKAEALCFWLDPKRKQMKGTFPLAVLGPPPSRRPMTVRF